ncbi:MAG TPA: peptide chain release factor N(5)-glutamine methyltransferase [Candidatus Sulfotelmatobacter sp.]|nr:peptide chain release factor N(5)-glutamine methyltransferase [Candidatus Sulfotelmatobacter sp.]
MTVLETIQKSAEFLTKRGVESPRLQAELLCAHLLKMPRMKLYLNFERPLTSQETEIIRQWIKRRGQREPLQHIIGSISFCGFEIAVDRRALVPRPETEILAELGWSFLSSLTAKPSTALDVGTGTGCIAIAIAAKCPDARIMATDLSTDALALAGENAAKNNVAGRIEFFHGNAFAALPPGSQFDLIISNPPYISTAEIETLQPEVRDFDPRAALDGGADGLDFYRLFAAQAKLLLKPGGKMMLEFGDGQAAAIQNIFEQQNWIVEAIKDDYSQRARILIASWKVS